MAKKKSNKKKIYASGDWHLGQSLKYGGKDTNGVSEKLKEQRAMVEKFVDDAIKNASIVVLTGDYFPKHLRINPDAMRIFAEQIIRLNDAAIPTFIVEGNHDKARYEVSDSTVALFGIFDLEHVKVISKPQVIWVDGVGLAMLPHLIPAELESFKEHDDDGVVQVMTTIVRELSNEVVAYRESGMGQEPCVLFGHFGIAEAGRGSETTMIAGNNICIPASVLDLPAFNYSILGHIHKRWDWEGQFSKIAYLGSMDRFDFAEADDIKKYGVISIEDDEVELDFVDTNARRFVDIKHDFEKGANFDFLDDYDLTDATVKITIKIEKDFTDGKELLKKIKEKVVERGAYYIFGMNLIYKPTYTSRNEFVTETESIEDNLERVLKEEGFSDVDGLMLLHEELSKELQEDMDKEAEKS